MIRRLLVLACATLLAALSLGPGPAQAENTYRYWSYWVGGDSWTYSARGPGFRVPPPDGVEGWHFVVSPKDGSQASAPPVSSKYADLCPDQPPAEAGRKRIAVVIDPGPAGIAPVGDPVLNRSVTCTTAPASSTGLQALQEVAQLRFHSSGLICGIGGFPSSECPGQSTVKRPSPTPSTRQPSAPAPITATAPAPEPVAPDPVNTPLVGDPAPSVPTTPSPTAATEPAPASPAPSAVALTMGEDPPESTASSPPPWIAAIGAAMIASLLGLALVIRRGRS